MTEWEKKELMNCLTYSESTLEYDYVALRNSNGNMDEDLILEVMRDILLVKQMVTRAARAFKDAENDKG